MNVYNPLKYTQIYEHVYVVISEQTYSPFDFVHTRSVHMNIYNRYVFVVTIDT